MWCVRKELGAKGEWKLFFFTSHFAKSDNQYIFYIAYIYLYLQPCIGRRNREMLLDFISFVNSTPTGRCEWVGSMRAYTRNAQFLSFLFLYFMCKITKIDAPNVLTFPFSFFSFQLQKAPYVILFWVYHTLSIYFYIELDSSESLGDIFFITAIKN